MKYSAFMNARCESSQDNEPAIAAAGTAANDVSNPMLMSMGLEFDQASLLSTEFLPTFNATNTDHHRC
jgi:hypothetical protein